VLQISKANYRLLIGVEPANLAPGSPIDRLSPPTLPAAIAKGLAENPNVTAAMYGIDVAYLQVKVNEGALYPTVSLAAQAQYSTTPSIGTQTAVNAAAIGQISVPIYQGGSEYSLIRQSKESYGQQRILLDQIREQSRQQVAQAWAQVEATKVQVQDAKTQIAAAERALNGVSLEARLGQRTTFDVLNAQQILVNARVAFVVAQHDRVVASYALLAAVGSLSPRGLGLATPTYDPMVHYQQVRDAWTGVRTPDGR